jgi:hypothetical protein
MRFKLLTILLFIRDSSSSYNQKMSNTRTDWLAVQFTIANWVVSQICIIILFFVGIIGWALNTISVLFFKIRIYFITMFCHASVAFLLLVCFDRLLLCSRDANWRRLYHIRIAYKMIIISSIVCTLLPLYIPFTYNQVMVIGQIAWHIHHLKFYSNWSIISKIRSYLFCCKYPIHSFFLMLLSPLNSKLLFIFIIFLLLKLIHFLYFI